jgi:hypothetical protein
MLRNYSKSKMIKISRDRATVSVNVEDQQLLEVKCMILSDLNESGLAKVVKSRLAKGRPRLLDPEAVSQGSVFGISGQINFQSLEIRSLDS